MNQQLPILAAPPAITDSIGSEKRVALIAGGLFFVGFLGWAAITPLDAGAYASGVVAVSGNRQAVQHLEGGRVAELLVKEGQRVEKGQPLLSVSDVAIEATERGLTREYLMLLAERARLVAERTGSATITPPAEFAGLPPADSAIATEALAAQQQLLAARRASLAQQKQVLGQQARQSEARISGFRAENVANSEQRRLIQDELAGLRQLAEKGFASQNRIRALERAAAALDGNVGSYGARIAEARESIGQSRMQALVLDATIIEETDLRLRQVATRLNEVQPRRMEAGERLSATVVRAPASGRVVGLSVFTVGGVVAPGQLLMDIVPDTQKLLVRAQLAPDDADDVRPGLVTEVRFPTIRDSNLPVVEGTVTNVSADSLVDERSGAPYFAAEISVPAEELRRIGEARPGRPPIQAGVPVDVLVRLEKRTLLDYLVQPLVRAMWRSGREH